MSDILEAVLQPVSDENPGGDDLRYEPLYQQVKQARTEEDDLPAGDWERTRKTADWPLVIRLTSEGLATRSKDLQLAAWYTEARLRKDGFPGLAQGLELIILLLENFWDHLYPAMDEDGDLEFRASPLDWVGQYLAPSVRLVPINREGHTMADQRDSREVGYEADADTTDRKQAREEALAAGKVSAEAYDKAVEGTPKAWYKEVMSGIEASFSALDRLDTLGQSLFGVDAPRFSPLRSAIQDVRQMVEPILAEKLKRDPDPVEVVAEVVDVAVEVGGSAGTAASDAGGSAGGSTGQGTLSATPTSRADAEARVASAAAYLRSQDPTDPAPYLLLRGFRWGELRSGGGTIDPRLLAAPPTEQRSRLRTLLLDSRWDQLLEGCEQLMATPYGRGWLDLQRYVLEACAGLGSEYDRVSQSVRRALQALLQDLPSLAQLTLMDDTPTANGETRAWLHEIGLLGSGTDNGFEGPGSEARTGGRSPLERAMERVRAGEPEKAIAMLIHQASQEKSERERFLRRSQAASIMVDVGREAVALPILQDLMAQIERHSLEDYEPGEVVAQPLGLLFRCLQRMDGDSDQMQELYLRICRLDPMQAIHLQGPTSG